MNSSGTLGPACVLIPMPAKRCRAHSALDPSSGLRPHEDMHRPDAERLLGLPRGSVNNTPFVPARMEAQRLPSPASEASVHIGFCDAVLVPLVLGPELLPRVGGFLCWHHFQPLLIISSEAINLLQVGVFPFVL